jgi:hypothetical protein
MKIKEVMIVLTKMFDSKKMENTNLYTQYGVCIFSLGIKTTIKNGLCLIFTIIMVGSTHIDFTLIKSDS